MLGQKESHPILKFLPFIWVKQNQNPKTSNFHEAQTEDVI